VRGVDLGEGDEVRWHFLYKNDMILMIISDRGFGKRMMASEVDRQKRATKGQKLLPMTKSGEIGTRLAAVLDATHAKQFAFTQKHGHVTTLNDFEIGAERRAGRGQLLVSVLLDDVVTEADVIR